ncbi:MAG: BatD family protein [bacterium]
MTCALLGALVVADAATARSRVGPDGRPDVTRHGRRERAQRDEPGTVDAPAQTLESTGEGGRVFLRAQVSDRTPFVGQQVVLVIQISSAVPIYKLEFTAPELVGLKQAQPFVESDYSTNESGVAYRVHEYRAPLFATRTGASEIGPASFTCRIKLGASAEGAGSMFEDFYSGRSIPGEGRTQPIRIDARPVPGDGRAPVGETEISAAIAPVSVKKGQPATLTIEVQSYGDDAAIASPRVAGLDSFQVVADQPVTEWVLEPAGAFRARKTFKLALLGSRAGEFQIPPITVPYVDPALGRLKEAASEALSVRVGRGLGSAATSGSGRGVDDSDVIRSVHASLPRATVVDPLAGPGAIGWAAAVAALLGAGGAIFQIQRARRAAADPRWARERGALRRAKHELERAERTEGEASLFYEQVGRVIRDFVAAKVDFPPGVLTPEEVESRLSDGGLNKATAGEVRELLVACELKRWARNAAASGAAGAGDGRADTVERARTLIARIDDELRTGARGGAT